jgi:ABC-type protease/lipase transport system fused ATPase/permease subunit
MTIKERNGIVIAVSHRPSILESFDMILLLKDGQAVAFGPRDEIMAKYFRTNPAIAANRRPPGAVVPMNRAAGGLTDGTPTP